MMFLIFTARCYAVWLGGVYLRSRDQIKSLAKIKDSLLLIQLINLSPVERVREG